MSDRPGAERPGGRRFDSWKEIAGYLRRDIRTVQRWEQHEGLPVHRHVHSQRPSIYAFESELDEWRAARAPGTTPLSDDSPGAALAGDDGKVATPPGVAPDTDLTSPRPAAPHRHAWTLVGVCLGAALAAGAAGAAAWLALREGGADAGGSEPPVMRVLANLTREGASLVRVPTGYVLSEAALSPDDRRLFVSATLADRVLVFDTVRQRVVRELPVPGRPGAVALSKDGTRLYVGRNVGRLTVVDTRTWSTTEIDTGGPITDLLVTPDGRFVYLALLYAGLARLDTERHRLERIPVVGCPVSLAAHSSRLYVSFECQGPGGTPGHDAVGAFDLATGRLTGRGQGPPQVGGVISASPDGAFLWVNGRDACISPEYDHAGCPLVPSNVVNAFSTTDLALVRSVPVGASDNIGSLRVLPGGRRTFIGGVQSWTVDARSFTIAERLPMTVNGRVVIASDGHQAWFLADRDIVGVRLLTASCDVPAGGLLHHWPADGADQDVVGDIATEAHGVTFGPGMVGQAFVFDSGRGDVRTNARRPIQWTFSDATLMAWVKFDAIDGEMPLVDRSGPTGTKADGWRLVKLADHRFAFCAAPEAACLAAPGTSGLVGRTTARAGAWYHVALTRSPGTTCLYVNGRLEAQAGEIRVSEARTDALPTIFGADDRGHHLRGKLDEVTVYAAALDAEAIARVYANAAAADCVGAPSPAFAGH